MGAAGLSDEAAPGLSAGIQQGRQLKVAVKSPVVLARNSQTHSCGLSSGRGGSSRRLINPDHSLMIEIRTHMVGFPNILR